MSLLAFFLQNEPDPATIQRIILLMIPIFIVVMLVVIAILMVPCWFILKKAGLSPWLSLLCLVPSLGLLILLYILAFSDWKVVPAPQQAWIPQPPYPPQPPYSPQPPAPPQG
jgi:hypothetical protein